jgi:hypothetical protein
MNILTNIFEAIALVIAVFCLYRDKSWYRMFIPFLLIQNIVEITGYVSGYIYHYNNHWLYNLNLPIIYSFTTFLFWKFCSGYLKKWRSVIIIVGLSIILAIYFYESIRSSFLEYSKISKIYFSVFVIVMCNIFYVDLLNAKRYINIAKSPSFWIVTGIFLFYFAGTASNFFFDHLISINTQFSIPVRSYIYMMLSFILYCSWSYAFICRHQRMK